MHTNITADAAAEKGMSARSLGIAILLHAIIIGVAFQQTRPDKPVQPQAVMSVAIDLQPSPSVPQQQSSPALTRAWPVPELELPGVVPAPDREIIPEPEPEPVFEPDPEFTETPEPSRREPVTKSDWPPRKDPSETEPTEQKKSDEPTAKETTSGKTGAKPKPGKLEGFPNPDTPPRILDPDWPRSVRRNFDGTVEVKVVVGTDGRAIRVEIQKGTGNKSWDDDLRDAFKEADYAPGVHHGTVLITSHVFRIHFKRTR